MAVTYPIDYPFYVDDEGWPEKVYTPPYPHEYYYDNGQNRNEFNSTRDQTSRNISKFNNDHHHKTNLNELPPLAIRRHTPGSTDPTLQQTSSRSHSSTSNGHISLKRNSSQSNFYTIPTQNHSSKILDPDERPIKPMKDTSVYYKPSSPGKFIQTKQKPLSRSKLIQSSPRSESHSFQLPPSRIQNTTTTPRRPILIDIIPKTPFGFSSQSSRTRQIVVEDYVDDNNRVASYVKPAPKKVVSYQEVSGMTTREMENYLMSKEQRPVGIRPPPIKTRIYRT
ncbi:unnamed protein product [Rotaria sordida]|uniref:Uncharacterized protein n=1 Tax=Rotaria sordida TaxID=392033 RepID=A0A819GAA9_9BILA|nr:unnamed protein product [Rotaria sordida]